MHVWMYYAVGIVVIYLPFISYSPIIAFIIHIISAIGIVMLFHTIIMVVYVFVVMDGW
jgi:type III secretory pathway component EscR